MRHAPVGEEEGEREGRRPAVPCPSGRRELGGARGAPLAHPLPMGRSSTTTRASLAELDDSSRGRAQRSEARGRAARLPLR
jgi:hypothetical protein